MGVTSPPFSARGPSTERGGGPAVGYAVLAVWVGLLMITAGWSAWLDDVWPAWTVAFVAAAVWGLNVLLVYYMVGPPFTISRIPLLSVVLGFAMTVVGTGSYWATTQLFPLYRVFIERAALFVAACTLMSLIGCIAAVRLVPRRPFSQSGYGWDWGRLRVITYALFAVCLVGTYMSIQRIGYIL